MADHANVSSIEAIEEFRVNLLVYQEKAAQTIDEISDDIKRVRMWLQNEAGFHWQQEIKKRTRKVEQMHAEYFNARMSAFRGASTQEQQAYARARRALHDAEDKLRMVKKWNRDFESTVGPMARKLDKLRYILADDGPKGVQVLNQMVKALSHYAEMGLGRKMEPPRPLSEEESATED